MALISDVERRSARARMLYVLIYLLLTIGSITMIYPLMIMLSSSVASEVDYERFHTLPSYLWNDDLLWRKYLGLKYDKDFTEFKYRYKIAERVGDFRFYSGTFEPRLLTPAVVRQVEEWNRFKAGLPLDKVDIFFTDKYRLGPTQLEYQDWLAEKYGTVQRFNLALDPPGSYRYFNDVEYFSETMIGHNWPPLNKKEYDIWLEFKAHLPPEKRRALSVSHEFGKFLESKFAIVENLNRSAGVEYQNFYDVEFSISPPANPQMRELWLEFARLSYPLRHVVVPGDYTEEFKRFILGMSEFEGDPEAFNEVVQASTGERRDYFAEIQWTETMPERDFLSRLWAHFVDSLPPERIRFYSLEEEYRRYLTNAYGSIDELNAAYGLNLRGFDEARPPYKEADLLHFATHKGQYKRHFFWGNYVKVSKYIYSNGYALKNTIILVFFWIFGSLTVQPMAAYALSRFNLSYANRILLFLIATMSFPHSVTMIPNFLLLKNLHLLNTYAALILPNLVQGMGIFLLKGYFDSLPRELYEAGMIDGATEFQMFLRITLPLSMPILAVIALHTFTAAYGSFMWAFLICQKESMWTLMVFLYQFKQIAPPYTHMAALVIAGLPTLIVFVFAQRIIMRGIVIPTMK